MPNYYKLQIKEIADLSKEYRVWKIHWIGQLSNNPTTGEMMIDLCLVPLLNSKRFKNSQNHEQLIFNLNFALKERQFVKVGVGQLPLLRIGAVYVDGFPYEYPKYITERFNFTVTETNQQIISSGSSWGKWGKSGEKERTRYFIPALQYQVFFANHSESNKENSTEIRKAYPTKCLVLDFAENERPSISLDRYPLQLKEWKEERGKAAYPNQDSPNPAEIISDPSNPPYQTSEVYGLIIPSIEMIRFYYTKSSQSCREILSGGLTSESNRMFDTTKTIKPNEEFPKGFLMLSKYVRNRDASIIARYAFDDYAMSQALNIFISSINNKSREGIALPEAKFPFRDTKTELLVHGTYLQSGNRIYFLVFWIENCTAEFPFKDVEYWRTNPGHTAAPQTEFDVWQINTSEINEDLNVVKIEGGANSRQENSEPDSNIKRKLNADGTRLQSSDVPSLFRERIDLLLKEEERFSYLRNCSIKPHQPKSIETEGNPTEEELSTFIGSNASDMETAGTAPSAGSKPITSISITPDPSEIEDLTSDNDFDEIVNLPKFEDLIDKPEESVIDSIKEDAEEFDNELPMPIEKAEADNKRLAINLEVFREILGCMSKTETKLQIRMIAVPPVGEPILTREGTTFPSRWTELDKQRKLHDKDSLLPEIYIAEIKNEKDYYAYLMDRKPITLSNNEVKGFQMFLCFAKGNHRKLKGVDLRQILEICERNRGKWIKPSSNKLPYIAKFKFKHDCNLSQTYADRVLKELAEVDWLT